jgi:hypothetical protein
MKIMEGHSSRNLILVLVSFSLLLLLYSIHFFNISLAQENVLENSWTSGTSMPTPEDNGPKLN